MTVTSAGIDAGVVTRQVRLHVRKRLEAEFRELTEFTRPALLRQFDEVEGTEVATVGRAIAITGYRMAAIQDHLDTDHETHTDGYVCANCCVLVDRGNGPKWLVLAALTEHDLPVIANDSALGRALIGARTGETVVYPDPTGPQTARVLALEPMFTS